LLAKAVANKTNANFYTIGGPEILSKYYGESEERLRNIFQEAQKNAPSIIFIDELDSIAPKREEVSGEVERRVVAQLLSLMDGLTARGKVVVIGATNRINAIDTALRRPGRFDRLLYVPPPDYESRKQIVQIHTKKKPLADDVNVDNLAAKMDGYTGADIAAVASAAVMLAPREHISKYKEAQEAEKNAKELKIHMQHFEEAMTKIKPPSAQELDMYKKIAERFGRPSPPTTTARAPASSNAIA
jgi:transitional endoplasmic reticulum ATPase